MMRKTGILGIFSSISDIDTGSLVSASSTTKDNNRLLEPIYKFSNFANTFHLLSLRIWFIHALTIHNWLFSLLILFVISVSLTLYFLYYFYLPYLLSIFQLWVHLKWNYNSASLLTFSL
jgi:hypothetical protein